MKTRQKIRQGIILIAFFMFPAIFFYFSPLAIITASSKGIINGCFIVFSLMFISSLFLGRGFCGWVCPGAGCQESIFPARSKKVTEGDWIKWLIWMPWFVSIVVFAVRSGGYTKIDFFYETTHGLSIDDFLGLIIYLFFLFVFIVLPAFAFGKRSFCHHLCWMAPFMITGRKIRNLFQWSSLQLKSSPELCDNCNTCSEHCPMSLPVKKMVDQKIMENAECILCGACVDGCRQVAITYDWGKSESD